MLGRIALSARLRPHTFPPPIRLAVSNSHLITRGYARERRIPKDYKLPSTAKLSEWQRQSASTQLSGPNTRPQTQRSTEESEQDYVVAHGEEAAKELDSRAETSQAAFPGHVSQLEDYHVAQGQDALKDLSSHTDQSVGTDPFVEQRSASAPSETLPNEPRPDPETERQGPLPDLRQGIPSTLDAELNGFRSRQEASDASLNITEDPNAPAAAGGGRGGDGLPRSSYISSSDRKKNTVFKFVYLAMAGGIVGYIMYLGRNWDDEFEEKKYPDTPSGWGLGLFYNRVKARLGANLDYYNDPVFTKLLPDEDKDPLKRFPFVLVLSLEDLLVHSEWTRETGWRIAKRPGLDYFLRYLCQYYEIVLFTSQPSAMAAQVYQKLDPFRIIQWPLYREATLYKDGGYIKDLSYLNRPLQKVLMIDTDPHHAKNQPENAIILPKWTGDPKDQTLVQMIPFLEYLANMGFDDCRPVLKSFEGTHIPAEFARREKLLRQKFEAQEAEKRGGRPKRKIGSLFGSTQGETSDEGKMLWDKIREQGQKQFEALDRQIKQEGDKWLAEEASAQKKLEEEAMKEFSNKGIFGYFGFGGGGEAKKE